MNTIIDAGSARLAGLQIDTLSKYRAGQLTLDQWERFNNLSSDDREEWFGDRKKPEPTSQAKPKEKFALLVDLGIITVPVDYLHANRLRRFDMEHREKFYYSNDNITDGNFSKPSRILKPGDKLHVRVFRQVVGGSTTSDERMAFLATQNAVHTGAQGASLVWEQKRKQLPKGKRYCSFDQKEALWKDADGDHRVPYVLRYVDGAFGFNLGIFERDWRDDVCLLCFCEI